MHTDTLACQDRPVSTPPTVPDPGRDGRSERGRRRSEVAREGETHAGGTKVSSSERSIKKADASNAALESFVASYSASVRHGMRASERE